MPPCPSSLSGHASAPARPKDEGSDTKATNGLSLPYMTSSKNSPNMTKLGDLEKTEISQLWMPTTRAGTCWWVWLPAHQQASVSRAGHLIRWVEACAM